MDYGLIYNIPSNFGFQHIRLHRTSNRYSEAECMLCTYKHKNDHMLFLNKRKQQRVIYFQAVQKFKLFQRTGNTTLQQDGARLLSSKVLHSLDIQFPDRWTIQEYRPIDLLLMYRKKMYFCLNLLFRLVAKNKYLNFKCQNPISIFINCVAV